MTKKQSGCFLEHCAVVHDVYCIFARYCPWRGF